jgi:hypothetical protein
VGFASLHPPYTSGTFRGIINLNLSNQEVEIMLHYKFKIILTLLLISLLILILLNGCFRTPGPIYYIQIFKANPMIPPSFGEGAFLRQQEPYPDIIQGTFSRDQAVFLGIVISKEVRNRVTFSKYTFYDKNTKRETDITSQLEDLGPFEPGQITLVAFSHPWKVPEKPDTYEIRVYLEKRIVASALFDVK